MFDKNEFYARTMHTPDDPDRARLRETLREISRILIPLHQTLIHAAKADYALAREPVSSPTHLLRLLKEDPFFAWLKPITSLIVDIDALTRVDFDATDVARIAERVRRLFGGNADAEFTFHYFPMLQNNVEIAMAHGALRRAMLKLERQH